MSKPQSKEELLAAVDAAQAAYVRLQDEEQSGAWRQFLNPGAPNWTVIQEDPTPVSDVAGASLTPLVLVLRHLGDERVIHQPTGQHDYLAAVLGHLADLLSLDSENLAGKLRALADDPRARNLLRRAFPSDARDLGALLAGLLLARL